MCKVIFKTGQVVLFEPVDVYQRMRSAAPNKSNTADLPMEIQPKHGTSRLSLQSWQGQL